MADVFTAGVFVAVVSLLSLLHNTFALVLFFRRKRLRVRAHLIPLFHLAGVDLLALITWSGVSVAIAVADWSPPPEVCQAHAYISSLWGSLHIHTMAVLAIERALALLKPSRHATIFVPRVMVFLLAGLWTFDLLVSSIPHYGWLDFQLVREELQCSPDFTSSLATLDFHFCVTLALPVFLVIVPCFALSFWKVHTARKNAESSGEIHLETNPYSVGLAYAERVTGFHSRFKQAGMKLATPTLGSKVFTDHGYVTDSDSDVNDTTGEELRAPKKIYSLARRDYVLLKTYVVLSCACVVLWLPQVAVTFVASYEPGKDIPGWVRVSTACLTHCVQVVLPLLYLTYNTSFRRCVLKTMCCGRRRGK